MASGWILASQKKLSLDSGTDTLVNTSFVVSTIGKGEQKVTISNFFHVALSMRRRNNGRTILLSEFMHIFVVQYWTYMVLFLPSFMVEAL